MSRHGDWVQINPDPNDRPDLTDPTPFVGLMIDQMTRTVEELTKLRGEPQKVVSFTIAMNREINGNFGSCPKPFFAWVAEIDHA